MIFSDTDLIGLKIIHRGNEGSNHVVDDNYLVGIFKGWTPGTGLPLIEVDGEIKIGMGIIVPYSPELAACLDKMSFPRQWEFMRDISITLQIMKDKFGRKPNRI